MLFEHVAGPSLVMPISNGTGMISKGNHPGSEGVRKF